MKAEELRIGNLRKTWIGSRQCILPFERSDFIDLDNIESDEPIPLAEEWLFRFGAIEEKIDHPIPNHRAFNVGDFHIKIYWTNQIAIWYKESPILPHQDWKVHQLQNIYFALKLEELEIKQ